MKRMGRLLIRLKNKLLKILLKACAQVALMDRRTGNAFLGLYCGLAHSLIDFRALPLVWMDGQTAYLGGLLRHGAQGIACSPHSIGGVQSTESVRLPDIHYYVFEKARVSAISSSVVLNDEQVIIDRAIGPDQDKYDYAGGHVVVHGGDTAVVRLGESVGIGKGIFLGGNGSFNYYHWMVEILAKLEFLPDLPLHYQKYPLLVSEDVINIPTFRETLNIFAEGLELVVFGKQSSYVVDELIYIKSPSNLPFNLFGNQKFKCSYVNIDKLSIDYLRKVALQNALKTPALKNYPKKIFLCRKNGLRNYNQDEVFEYLSALGFTKIFMEDLSFMEQVRTVYHADYMVGPTGAAWTNLIFCRSGAKGLCWMAEEFGDFSAYSTIAGMVGVDLRYLAYKAGTRSTGELYCKDYRIDLNMIKRGLSVLEETRHSQSGSIND
jgi:capsular polysaccharide biosynthesis protein